MESSCKTSNDREKLWDALNNDLIDVIATDHAPHTIEENKIHIPHVPLVALWFNTRLFQCLKHIIMKKSL